jgi:DNA-binding LacI/PurR family transcriptional regulator
VTSSRRATIADVAREAGVSVSTASVVFSGRTPVSDGTRQRVVDAAAALGYTGPDPRAASLRRGRSGIVAVAMQLRLGDAFLDPVMRLQMDGLTDALAPVGSDILLIRHQPDVEAVEHSLLTTPMDAAVFMGASPLLREAASILVARGIPVVVIEGDGGEGVVEIRLDNRDAQRQLARHLARLGHERVATVTLPRFPGAERGWLDAAGEAGIRIQPARERLAGARDVFPDLPAFAAGASLIDEGLAAGRALFADPRTRPTAVIAQSDLLAAGVIRAAEDAGLRVPHDVSVTGFDGVVVDGLAPYRLTTIVQPAADKGRAAGEAVVAMLGGGRTADLLLTCEFRDGNTTGPPTGT